MDKYHISLTHMTFKPSGVYNLTNMDKIVYFNM